ncbi:uncharacterized protein LOC120679326 isoform X2 [Panicum virgatum]|uniref:uncharacterized protein LOC120679326 isoform X2 n=1 Tax=Panicum virgatum TaxID=38727 RepID=UPI0019D5DC5E|nr:uncharacterized protein LOC120679326 isoform X2 [Panicum virgatum]
MSSTAFAPSTRADARTAPLPAARLAWPRDAPRTAARASPARWRHPTPAVLLFARGVRKMERALPATTMREMLPRTSSTTTYKATQTVLHQLYEMNPPSYTWLYNYVSLGWTIRWRLFPSPARNALCYGSFLWLGSYLTGEAGLGLVSDDHTPSPIRQMDQDPVHSLARKLLRSYLLVKKLQMAVVAVTVVQPPLIRNRYLATFIKLLHVIFL